MLAGGLAKCLSQRRDGYGQVLFFNDGVGPHPVEQGILFKNFSTVLNQSQQGIKRLGRKRHSHVPLQQELFVDVQAEGAEFINLSGGHVHNRSYFIELTKFSKNLPPLQRHFITHPCSIRPEAHEPCATKSGETDSSNESALGRPPLRSETT